MPLAGPPASARVVLGDLLPAAERFAALLAGPGVERGLIGPAEAARIWDRHILNCAVVAELVPDQCLLADLGSGAGLPGIVLALLRPQAEVLLIESLARRVAFLDECVAELGLTNVRVLRGRGEDLADEVSADIVTARAVAPLGRLAGWAIGLCRPGGTVLAIKGASAASELAAAAADLRRLGVTRQVVLQVGSGIVDPPATVVRFVAPRQSRAASRTSRPGGRGQGRPGSGPGAPGSRSGGRAHQGRPGAQRPRGGQRGPRTDGS